MNTNDKAIEWARYAEASCTESGRLGALMSALNESPQVLDLTLKKLKLTSIKEALEWAWSAEKANRSWMKK